jgi:pSer/pThr/pTyr-binding forkhead associated (FHA) protein
MNQPHKKENRFFLYRVSDDGSIFGRCATITKSVVVGRGKTTDVKIDDDVTLSCKHFSIKPEGGALLIRDLNSTNGTWVNDRRIACQRLGGRDHVRAGRTHFAIDARLALKIAEARRDAKKRGKITT